MKTRITLFYILSLIILVATGACHEAASEKAPEGAANTNSARKDTSASTTTGAAASGKIKVKTPDDKPVVEFEPQGQDMRIEFTSNGQTRVLKGESKETGKRKYVIEGSGQFAEVKEGERGFKVRNNDGKLLWKVKLAVDKIKISDNEEGANPFVLETKTPDRVKVLRDTTEIGKVNFYRDRGKVKVKNTSEAELYDINTDRYSSLYGVMLMDKIPEMERYIIMAEILTRGR